MSHDKTLETIGKILLTKPGRDAIHVAVTPVAAHTDLTPGQHIGLVADGVAGMVATPIGIVDPFLPTRVRKGELFWMFLYPGTITSLRHEWVHPAFNVTPERISQTDHVTKSHTWIAEHANHLGLSAAALMKHADEWLRYEEHTVQHGDETWRDNFRPTEFWHHYEIVTGTVVEPDKKRSFYCCTC